MRLNVKAIRRAIVVAPHPDDEIIGAAALIRRLRQQGSDVRVIVVSDGAASHPQSVAWPHRRLTATRRRESLHALARLGVEKQQVTFLRLPDGGLSGEQGRCRRHLATRLARHRTVDLIVGPAPTDAHPDHRAVAMTLGSLRPGTRHLTYQVWPPQRHPNGRCRTLTMPGGAAAKRSLIRAHRTQLGAISDDPHGFTIARHELAVFSHPVERFVAVRW